MSYLDNRISRNEFITTRGAKETQSSAKTALTLFDHFCKDVHSKEGDEVILDIQTAIKLDNNYDRLFRLCNGLVQWLLVDHPEIKVNKYLYTTYVKKHNPSSIRLCVSYLRQYLEEFGQIEFSERRFKRMVKLPRPHIEDPEPFKDDEIRAFIEVASPQRRALYMSLKDSGMRIGEAVQLRKSDIDMEKNPISIVIRAGYTKTKRGRTAYVTRETRPHLTRLLAKLDDDDLVFGCNEKVKRAVSNEENIFTRFRGILGLTEKYTSNNRYKKNLHSLRAYCATQLAEVYGEEWSHAYIGHKGYLRQYMRSKDKVAEKYLRAENVLMLYETVEVIDQSLTIEQAKKELRQEIKDEFRKDRKELFMLLKNKKEIEKLN